MTCRPGVRAAIVALGTLPGIAGSTTRASINAINSAVNRALA